jgi:hypothetical protein
VPECPNFPQSPVGNTGKPRALPRSWTRLWGSWIEMSPVQATTKKEEVRNPPPRKLSSPHLVLSSCTPSTIDSPEAFHLVQTTITCTRHSAPSSYYFASSIKSGSRSSIIKARRDKNSINAACAALAPIRILQCTSAKLAQHRPTFRTPSPTSSVAVTHKHHSSIILSGLPLGTNPASSSIAQ